MTPVQLATQLRRIAAAVDNSKQPSKGLVAKAIREIVVAAETGAPRPAGKFMVLEFDGSNGWRKRGVTGNLPSDASELSRGVYQDGTAELMFVEVSGDEPEWHPGE